MLIILTLKPPKSQITLQRPELIICCSFNILYVSASFARVFCLVFLSRWYKIKHSEDAGKTEILTSGVPVQCCSSSGHYSVIEQGAHNLLLCNMAEASTPI